MKKNNFTIISKLTLVFVLLGAAQTGLAEGDIAAGKIKAVACQVCHGKGGKSTNPLYPILAGQHANYLVKQLKAFKSGTRKDPIMNGMAEPLTEQDMEDVATYFQSNRD